MSTFDLHFWIYLFSVYILVQIIPLCGKRLIINISSYAANWKETPVSEPFSALFSPSHIPISVTPRLPYSIHSKIGILCEETFHKIPLRRNLKTGEQQIQKYFRRLIQTPTERNNSNSTWGKSFICKLANAATKSELRWVISYFW